MSSTTVGREPVQLVEIIQPLCANTYGSAPCTASGSADEKCYNTRATCQDTANFDGSSTLSLFFSSGLVSERGISGANYIIPALKSVSTSPTKVNLSGSDPDAKGLGNRALCNINLQDHPHTDRLVDPYLAGRSWNPFDRGSFWSKWLVRNRYRSNIVVRVYEGYAGQALGAMQSREYIIEKINGPDINGNVQITAKDILAKLEERKAQCPEASKGVLFSDLSSSDDEMFVTNAIASEYDSAGYVRINEEIIYYSSITTEGAKLVFNGLLRGQKNTSADNHTFDTTVQLCKEFANVTIDDAMSTLLQTYAGISASYLNTAGWATEIDTYASIFTVDRFISEPTSVYEIVSDLQTQTNTFLWWDERNKLVQLQVIRGINSTPDTLSDALNILENSWAREEYPRERVTQLWLYFDRRNGVAAIEDENSYKQLSIVVNAEEKTDALYGESSIREIFGSWINKRSLAGSIAARQAYWYKDTPEKVTLKLDAKDRDYDIGDVVNINHYLDVDQFGAVQERRWMVIQREETLPGEEVKLLLQDVTPLGMLYAIASNAEGVYNHGTDAGRFVVWITDANGEYPGNYPGATIG